MARSSSRTRATHFHDDVGDDGISDEAVRLDVDGADEQQFKQDQRQFIAEQQQTVERVLPVCSTRDPVPR